MYNKLINFEDILNYKLPKKELRHNTHEHDISTQKKEKDGYARFSEEDKNDWRAAGFESAPRERQEAPVGLIRQQPMLPKTNRLRKQKDIDEAFSKSRTVKDGYLAMKAAKNSLDTIRFCFIVSHRVSKNAVGRNKIKRRLREIARSRLKDLVRGYDLLVIASPGALKLSFLEMKSGVGRLFERLGLLMEN